MTSYQPTYPPPPVYPSPPVNRHEGLAVAALVLGIIGVCFGIIPLTFWIALPLGVLALVFGLIGRRPTKGKWGVALGVVAIGLGVIGAVIVNSAVNDLNNAFDTSTVDTSVLDTSVTGHQVAYAVDGMDTADVTYTTASGQTQDQGVAVPWTDLETLGAGDVPIVLAQDSGGGYVTCAITVDGVLVSSNSASGEYAVAECDADMLF